MPQNEANLQPKRISVLVLFLFIAFIAAIAWFKASGPGGIGKTGQTAVLPKTASLTLESEQKSVAPGETVSARLILDTGDQGVEAADFVLNFDARFLNIKSVVPGNFFKSYPANKSEGNTLRISAVAYFDGSSVIIPKGRGEVASLTFEAVSSAAKTSIKVDRAKTIIAASGQNILATDKISDLTVSIR